MHVDVYNFCGKFHAVKMNQIVLIGGFIKLVWEDENYFEPALSDKTSNATNPMPPSKYTFVENKQASKQNQS